MYGQVSPLSPLVCFLTRTQQLEKILRFREATLSQIILEKLVNKSVNTVKAEREFFCLIITSYNKDSQRNLRIESQINNLKRLFALGHDGQ